MYSTASRMIAYGGPKRDRSEAACGVYMPDLEQPRPPDAPPGLAKLRLVKKAD